MHKFTEYIFEKIDKNVTLPKEILKVYNLTKQYSERIRFVKDHAGLNNVLFLAVEETDNLIFDVPYFCLYENVNIDKNNQEEQLIENAEDIYKETKNFLENTNETLYLGIGFKECYVNNIDHFQILHLLEDTKCSVNDAYVTLRRFPEWYKGEYPLHILEEEKYLELLFSYEKKQLEKMKKEVLKELDIIMENNDKKSFKNLSKKINLIENQIQELEQK